MSAVWLVTKLVDGQSVPDRIFDTEQQASRYLDMCMQMGFPMHDVIKLPFGWPEVLTAESVGLRRRR